MLPFYLSIGLSKEEIDISCPAELKPYEDANTYKMMRQDTLNWYNGIYTLNAMITAIDKAFNGKRSTMKYIEKPLLADATMSEEEKYERDLKKALAFENEWLKSTESHLPESFG